jgi:hypothetical protein
MDSVCNQHALEGENGAPRSCTYASASARGLALIGVRSSTIWPGVETWWTEWHNQDSQTICSALETCQTEVIANSACNPHASRVPSDLIDRGG